MTEFCQHCNKQYANKRSLATHKSRYHQEKRSKNSNSHGDDDASTASGNKEQTRVDGLFNQHSEEDPVTPTSNPSPSSPEKQSDRESKKVTDRHSEADSSKEYSSASGNDDVDDSDQVIDVTSEDSTPSKNQQYRSRRKGMASVASFNDTLTKIYDSIKQLLQGQDRKENEDCFDLLLAYTLKKNLFAELENYFEERGKDMNMVLSEEELYFIDAVLAATNLSDLAKLMNENSGMVKSILNMIKRRK